MKSLNDRPSTGRATTTAEKMTNFLLKQISAGLCRECSYFNICGCGVVVMSQIRRQTGRIMTASCANKDLSRLKFTVCGERSRAQFHRIRTKLSARYVKDDVSQKQHRLAIRLSPFMNETPRFASPSQKTGNSDDLTSSSL